jgi:Putative Flp pilus-assembly TadE/G-like
MVNRFSNERGQTIILVAVALVALLSMAALAVDVVTLYVARGEAQRAANAAAIAGAKMFTTSGFTSVQGGAPPPVLQGQVCLSGGPASPAAANAQAAAVAAQNTVVGQPAIIQSITCNFSLAGNPQITVTVARSGLPTFFARIWNRASNSVSATAIAEAYNPSGNAPPIQTSVKPWFIPNCDPGDTTGAANPTCPASSTAPFVNTAASPNDGSIANNGSFIGKTLQLTKVPFTQGMILCAGGCTPCPGTGCDTQYYPLNIPETTAPVCPSPSAGASCTNVGTGNDYFDNIACSSQRQISCGQILGRGETVDIVNNNNDSANTPGTEATQCLIHANSTGAGQGQDIFAEPAGLGTPLEITGGDNNPNLSLRGATNISRSDAVVTVPLYDTVGGGTPLNLCRPGMFCNRDAVVVGFLQLAITQANPNGVFQGKIVNAAGCNPTPTGNTVSGGGVSPVPVRLISQ